MIRLRYDKIYDSIKSEDELLQIFNKNEELELEIPFDSINITNSHLDIMNDYLNVSYVSEHIAIYSEIIDYGNSERDKHFLSFIVSFKPKNIKELTKFIYHNCKCYSNFDEFDSDEIIEYNEKIIEYESKIEELYYTFPELIDSYYANLVNAGYYEIAADYEDDEEDYLKTEFKKYPERKFGFWRSAVSQKLKSEVFVSSDSWIIPSKYDLINILKSYSVIGREINIEKADNFEYNGKTLISNKFCAVWYTVKKEFAIARNCALTALDRFIEHKSKKELKYLLSEFGDILIIEVFSFYFVFFLNNAKLNFNELNKLRTALHPTCENITSILGLSRNLHLDWSKFDDEKFEQLCYDILYFHPKFDRNTIRKLGKSRSRDGGRDITIRTRPILGKDSDLYIFQCKYYQPNTSLSASKIGDAANTIMQYGAKGYGVFTTGIIDATLYDMLDGFAENYKISTRENWSIFEIEKYLSRNEALAEKYF